MAKASWMAKNELGNDHVDPTGNGGSPQASAATANSQAQQAALQLPPDIGSVSQTVHIQYVPVTMTEAEFEALLRPSGSFLRVRICGNVKREQNWIYSFVEFENEQSAANFIKRCHNMRLGPFKLACTLSRSPIVDRLNSDWTPQKPVCTFAERYPDRTLKDHIRAQATMLEARRTTPGGPPPSVVGPTATTPISGPQQHSNSNNKGPTTPILDPSKESFVVSSGSAGALPAPATHLPPPGSSNSAHHHHQQTTAGGHGPQTASSAAPPTFAVAVEASTAAAQTSHTSRLARAYSDALHQAIQCGLTFNRDRNMSHYFEAMHLLQSTALPHAMELAGPNHTQPDKAAALAPQEQYVRLSALFSGEDRVFNCRMVLTALCVQHGSVTEAIAHAHEALMMIPPVATVAAAALAATTGPRLMTGVFLNHLVTFGLLLEGCCTVAARAFYHMAQHRASIERFAPCKALDEFLEGPLTPTSMFVLPPSAAQQPQAAPSLLKLLLPSVASTQSHSATTAASLFFSHFGAAAAMALNTTLGGNAAQSSANTLAGLQQPVSIFNSSCVSAFSSRTA